jgi:hypothetical protein
MSTGVIEVRQAETGSTIPNIVEMLLMVIAEQPTSSVDVARVAPVVRAVLAVSGDRAVQVAWVA